MVTEEPQLREKEIKRFKTDNQAMQETRHNTKIKCVLSLNTAST